MQSISFLSVVFLLLTISPLSQAQVVCSEDELIRELREDIEDNGKLDCLRVSLNPVDQDETEAQKARRIASQWVSDCSFEAENTGLSFINLRILFFLGEGDWFQKLQQNYGLKKGLVDVNGNPVDRDFSDQADMCEIVRALIANGKIDGAGDDVTNLNVDILDNINCVGGDGNC